MSCAVCGLGLIASEEASGICRPCATGERKLPKSVEMEAQARIEEGRRRAEESERAITGLLLTTECAPTGLSITRRIDVVTAECVLGVNVLKEVLAGITDFVGGRSDTVQKVFQNARQMVLSDLRRAAHGVGANAVVGVTLSYSELSGQNKSMLMVVACGTAVEVEQG